MSHKSVDALWLRSKSGLCRLQNARSFREFRTLPPSKRSEFSGVSEVRTLSSVKSALNTLFAREFRAEGTRGSEVTSQQWRPIRCHYIDRLKGTCSKQRGEFKGAFTVLVITKWLARDHAQCVFRVLFKMSSE